MTPVIRCIPALFFLVAVTLRAQTAMPAGVIDGRFVAWTGSSSAGELTVRSAQNKIYSCRYDAKTYVEMRLAPVPVTSLIANDPVEVLADHHAGSDACYTRMIHVVDLHPKQRIDAFADRPMAVERPRGDLSFAGVVAKIGPGLMTLRTRSGAVQIALRGDTKYVGGGVNLDRTALAVNTHVFVRAGRDIDRVIEAYQIIWGAIVEPE